jgi:hypothetical protein
MKKILFSFALLAMIFSVQDLKSQELDEILGQVANASGSANYEIEYQFDLYLQLEVAESGGEPMVFNGYLTKDGQATAIIFTAERDKSVIVIDSKNNTLLMLSEEGNEKTGFAMGLDPEAIADLMKDLNVEMQMDSYAEFKTGNTKDIMGYSCDEYLIKEEGTEVRMWVSPELGKEIPREIITNQKSFGSAFMQNGLDGMVLEYQNLSGSDGDGRIMKITQLELDTNFTVATSDYTVMSMGQ